MSGFIVGQWVECVQTQSIFGIKKGESYRVQEWHEHGVRIEGGATWLEPLWFRPVEWQVGKTYKTTLEGVTATIVALKDRRTDCVYGILSDRRGEWAWNRNTGKVFQYENSETLPHLTPYLAEPSVEPESKSQQIRREAAEALGKVEAKKTSASDDLQRLHEMASQMIDASSVCPTLERAEIRVRALGEELGQIVNRLNMAATAKVDAKRGDRNDEPLHTDPQQHCYVVPENSWGGRPPISEMRNYTFEYSDKAKADIVRRVQEKRLENMTEVDAKKAAQSFTKTLFPSKHALRASLAAMIAAAFVSSAFWLNGFNFDERGEPAGVWFVLSGLLSLAASIITYIVSRETSQP